MATPRHVTDQLIQLHAAGDEDSMKEAAKVHQSLEPKRQRASQSRSKPKSGAKSKQGK